MAARSTLRNVSASAAVLLGGVFLLPSALGLLRAPADAPSARGGGSSSQIFLVFPFENPGRVTRLDWLGEGLEELTNERLAAAGQRLFTHEERQAVLEKSGLPPSTRFSRATMLKIAEDLDADFIVFGRYVSDGKSLKIAASLLRVSPPSLMPVIQEAGPLEDLMNVHQRLAWRLLQSADPSGFRNLKEFAKLQRPLRMDAFEQYVRGLLAADDEQKTRNLLEAARLDPAWVDPAYALGRAYFARRDCNNALAWLSKVPPVHDRGAEASFYSGVCHLQRNDATRAEAAFSGLLKRYAGHPGAEMPDVLNNLAIVHERMGKSREAEAELGRAAQLDPGEVDYRFNQALVRYRWEDPASAVEPLREVLRREPDDPEAWALLVAALEKSGRTSEASAEREAGLKETGAKSLAAPKPDVLLRMDRVKTSFDVSELRDLGEPTPETPPDNGSATAAVVSGRQNHLKRGRQFLAAGKMEEAGKEFSAVLAQYPRDSAAHQGLAETFRRQGKLEDAVRELRASLEARDDAEARTTLARIYLEQKKPDEARAQLQLALKLAPGYADARALLDKLGARKSSGERK